MSRDHSGLRCPYTSILVLLDSPPVLTPQHKSKSGLLWLDEGKELCGTQSFPQEKKGAKTPIHQRIICLSWVNGIKIVKSSPQCQISEPLSISEVFSAKTEEMTQLNAREACSGNFDVPNV